MRKRKLEYDGAIFVISPLTMDQVEKYTEPIPDFNGLDISAKRKALRERTASLLADSLNNAMLKDGPNPAPPENPWTVQSILSGMDLKTFGNLQEEILKFSELEVKKPGGAEAAVEEPSPESVAVS